MDLLLAMQFLTRIPVTVRGQVGDQEVARAMAYFPLVGLLLGLGAAALHTLVSATTAASVGDLLAVVFLIIVTGNMHGDGLMDTADGLFSGKTRERILEIMKDSRVGAHGVTAGVLVILAKFVILGQIPAEGKGPALILAPVLGRWAQVYGAALYPYARTGSGVASFVDHVGRRELFWASLTVLAATFSLLGMQGSAVNGVTGAILEGGLLAGAALMSNALLARYVSGKLGGLTGDALGAMNECTEVLSLLMLLIIFTV